MTISTPGPEVDLIEYAAKIIVEARKDPLTAPAHWAGALLQSGMLVPPGHASERPALIDPADVKVGDVVEVEADDGSWLVRGEVGLSLKGPVLFVKLHDGSGAWLAKSMSLSVATVRLVRRAEPEPDPEQVKALADAIDAAEEQGDGLFDTAQLARELVRRGVTVRKEN